jgi:hypothetical protein
VYNCLGQREGKQGRYCYRQCPAQDGVADGTDAAGTESNSGLSYKKMNWRNEQEKEESFN